ncbi:MAG: MaoC/PaaZ C-terminal domain-containing protein [Pseudomonadota bacterium]
MTPTAYLEDLTVGDVRYSQPASLSEAEIVEFATQWDPQYFHMDPAAARDHTFGQVAASGIHILALWRRLDHEISGDIRWVCGISWEHLRWAQPLHAEVAVRACFEIKSKRYSSKPGRGVVNCGYSLIKDDGQPIFYCDAVSLVEARGAANPVAG